ncbi:MAG: hypothetical protein K5884_10230 [Ruminococcus sp.]|nr:hypothetical protein [Ruminococcus sp.]
MNSDRSYRKGGRFFAERLDKPENMCYNVRRTCWKSRSQAMPEYFIIKEFFV